MNRNAEVEVSARGMEDGPETCVKVQLPLGESLPLWAEIRVCRNRGVMCAGRNDIAADAPSS